MREKKIEYATKILGAIGSMFEEGSEWEIDQGELGEEDNLTVFFHALANIVPTHLYNELTADDKDQLEFNHIANKLCFQYSNKKDD